MFLNEDRDDVAFLTGSGSSESRYSKRDLYERGHVAVCSHKQAICITVFVFTTILSTSIVIAFVRPWNDCGFTTPDVEENTEPPVPIATNGEVFPWNNVRLPIFVRPISYDLELTPNISTLAVRGIIKLIFQVTEETEFIVFHSKNISITSKTINEKLKVQRLLEYPEQEQLYLETDQPMKPGKTYSIRLKFQYNLSESLEGFYLSTYRDKDGNERRLATTHFEPTSARKAFPCFDEPQLKAKFLVTITHDREYHSFFNMPHKEQTAVRGRPEQVRTEFQETEEMSTYLVAFVICDFHSITNVTKTNITVSVIAAEEKIDQAKFALDQATQITENYEEFFGIPYPLPKQDLIAIPDFGAGAMENWGLITYRETSLLYKNGETSSSAQQWVAVVIAHELAHQWFGNLVTMRWWNDLWLNEGFASWMEYKGVDKTQPAWRMMDQFWSDVTQPALALDSLYTSHPVSVPVNDPKEIEAIFDTISYKKGSAIIHMLESYMGIEDLRHGLKLYLNKHKFKNAVTKDLWESLTLATNHTKDIEGMMSTWTLQMGYPLVTFSRLENSSSTWHITQQRFLLSAQLEGKNASLPLSKFNYSWLLPVDFTTNLGYQANVLLSAEANNSDAKVIVEHEVAWIKANLNGNGYYRVHYPPEIWSGLVEQMNLNHTVFSPTDRAQILDDAFTLCMAGLVSHEIPLNLTRYLVKETELVPWEVAIKHLRSWEDLFRDGLGRQVLEEYKVQLMEKVYNSLGWQDEGEHVIRLLRNLLLTEVVKSGYKPAVLEARGRFSSLFKNGTAVTANFQDPVYGAGVREGGRAEWDWAHTRYTTTKVPSERSLLLRALAQTRDNFILQEYLDMTLNKTQVRSQDVRTVLASVAENPAGTLLAWRQLQRFWTRYFEMFGHGSFTMGSIIKAVTAFFSTQFDYDQVSDFFDGRDVGAGKLSLEQALETIQIHIHFREQCEAKILGWVRAQAQFR